MTGKVFDANNQITDISTLEKCVFGGKGQIDLVSPSGTSHCYRFEIPKNPNRFPNDIRFVYAIHEDKKFYLGMIEHRTFRLTANSRFDVTHDVVKGAEYIVRVVNTGQDMNKLQMKFYHNGRCAMCGRKLTSNKWHKLGLGKRCLKKYEELIVPNVGERTQAI